MNKLFLKKLKSNVSESGNVSYFLNAISLNELLGKSISIKATGVKECIHCSRSINKTFNQGFCFPCAQSLARCDICIIKPEKCHFDKGTCREPEWGEKNCMIPHVIYLANTSGLKVGITREHQKIVRWVDQGATEAVVMGILPKRLLAGELEVSLAKLIDDKTNWRKLLKGEVSDISLLDELDIFYENVPRKFEQYLLDPRKLEVKTFNYPVLKFLEKATTHNLDKNPEISGELKGIKGQYLFFDKSAINIRKYQGYEVEVNF